MEYAYNEQEGLAFQQDVQQSYQDAGQTLDFSNVVWALRMSYDARGMGYPASRSKHLTECRTALGLTTQPAGVATNLITRGAFFAKADGSRFTAIESSDFALMARWQHGEDITSVLLQRARCGFNMVRVWTAFDIPNIGTFTDIDYSRIPAFVALCAEYGLYVEFTAYTGINDPTHWQQLIAASLQCPIYPLLELVNELSENENEPDSQGRVFNLGDYAQAPAPLLSSHGSNGSEQRPVRPWWSYETFHTNDANEWWRKVGHNAMENSEGAEGLAASHVPILTNENTRYDDKTQSSVYAQDGAAGAALLCAGSCYHSINGKTAQYWTPDEEAAAQMWAFGAQSVDLACQDGSYRHAQELETEGILRAYQRVVGGGTAYTVLIRK